MDLVMSDYKEKKLVRKKQQSVHNFTLIFIIWKYQLTLVSFDLINVYLLHMYVQRIP